MLRKVCLDLETSKGEVDLEDSVMEVAVESFSSEESYLEVNMVSFSSHEEELVVQEVNTDKITKPLAYQHLGQVAYTDREPGSHRAQRPWGIIHERESTEMVRKLVKDVIEPQVI